MFKQKINLLLLGLLWIANWGYAQNNNGIGASPASTPSAAAAGKYNDAPVSMHTGTVSASIPIYTIGNAGGLSASVGLGYHAGGVRVADISTSVGMGWTLNAGGSITRTVRNAPDEGIMRNAAGRGKGWYQTTPTAIAAAFATTGAHSGEDQQKMTNGEWDTEPDVFQYNLPGYSGKFYFKHNANGTPIVVFLNATQDIKIEPNYKPSNSDCGSFDSWIITTPDGIRYHFGSANLPELTGADPAVDLSFSFVYGSGFAGNTYVSSWNLTKIESPDLQHHIDFLYIRETYRYVNRGGDHTTGNYTTDADREVHTQVWGARLKEIKSDVEKIEFLTGTVDRKDLDLLAPTGIFNYFSNIAQNQAKPLSNIKVSTIVGSQQIRRFELEQGYLRSAFTGYPNDYSVDNATQTDIYRLYLRRVREFGEQNTVATQKVHELNYIGVPVSTAEFVDVALPRRKSAATDIWGFYNGKDDNKYLTAICDIYDQSQLDYGTAPRQFKNASYGDIGNKFLSEVQILENSFGTGNINDFIYKMKRSIWGVTLRGHSETDVFINLASDKTPSATHMAIGTLDKITYPMGGITQYEYEPHQYRAKTAELKFVHPLKEATTSQSQKVFSSIFGGQTTPLPVNPDVHQIALRIQNAYIDVPNNKISRLKYALYLENQNPTNALVQTMEFRVRIKKNGNVLAGEKIFLVNESRKLLVVEDFIPNLWNLPIDLTGDGNPFTNLEIQIYANNAGGQNLCKVRFSMFYETLGVKEEDKIAGGLRIKNVKTLENPNATPIVTHYDYKTTDGVSSGVLPVMPRVIYNLSYGAHTGTNLYNTIVQQGAVPTYMFSFVWEVKEGSLFGAGSNNQTGAIGYKEVKVWKTGLGHSRYYYFIQQPMESQPSAYPEVPEYSISGKTGMLLREEHFNQNNQMVSQTTFDYIESMPNAPFFGTNFIEGYNFTKPMHARIAKYRIDLGYRVYLNSKTETVDGVSTTTDYSYDPQWRHHLPITTRVKNSDGNVYKSRTYYAAARDEDTVTPEELISGRYAQELALAAYWVSKRMLHLPLKTEAYVNNTLKVAAKTNFSSTTFGGLKRPISIETFQNGVWTTEMTMAYNPDGLPISTTAKGFTEAQIFVWNANRTLQSKTFGGFTTSYKYDDRKRITQVTNPNGQKAKFYYDEFGRTVKTEGAFDINDVPNIIKTVNYQYRNANNPESFVETSIWTSDLSDINSSGVIKSKQWIDGLGRAKGSIGENYTPDQKHLKSYLTYDLLGRVDKMFEPFESQSTNFEAAPANTPYVTNDYEASPLGRTLRHHNADQTQVSVAYASNAANEVKIYQLSSGNITGGGTFYGANLLYKTISTDENGHQSAAFTDKIGRTIMTRRYGVGETLDTYVLYDEFGNVTAVIPPLNDNEEANKVSYFYRYDQRNRLRAKKIPSAEWQYFYYNQRDMLALTQDGNMAQESQQKHLYMQYDALGRPTQTGFVFVANPTNEVDNNNRAIDPDFLLSEVTYRIDKTYIDKTKVRVLEVLNGVQWIETQNHYDDFGRLVSANGNNHLSNDPTAEIVSFTPKFYGAAVNASRSHRAFNHIDINQTPTFDHMLRLKTMSHETTIDGNSLGNRTISENVYNYKNQLTEQRLGYHASTGKWLQNVDFTYNVRGWLTAINPFQNSGPIQQCNQQLLKLEANGEESGGGSGGNCTLSNAGTVLTDDDLFHQEIRYGNPTSFSGLSATPQYNGNISQTVWQVKGRERQGYNYQYDSYDRLTRATYFDIHDDGSLETDNKYGEFVRYDRRGNIKVLERRGMLQAAVTNSNQLAGIFGTIDMLNYSYRDNNPNQLRIVSDGADAAKGYVKRNNFDYEYDLNGNLTKDPQKEILYIRYNYLNLPVEIMFTDRRVIQFLYDASGQKLRKTVSQLPDDNNTGTLQFAMTTVRDYFGGIEYQDGVLDLVHHGSGGVTRNDKKGEFEYFYALRDHLGNTRVTFMDLDNSGTVDASTEIIQINHYYAFGMNMEGNWNGADGKLKYQFTGQEFNDDFGLGWSHHNARFYDAALGRWHSVDLLAEATIGETPYHYCSNNPVNAVDPSGMAGEPTDGNPVAGSKLAETQSVAAVDISACRTGGGGPLPMVTPTLTSSAAPIDIKNVAVAGTPPPPPPPPPSGDAPTITIQIPVGGNTFSGATITYMQGSNMYNGTAGNGRGAGAPSGGNSQQQAVDYVTQLNAIATALDAEMTAAFNQAKSSGNVSVPIGQTADGSYNLGVSHSNSGIKRSFANGKAFDGLTQCFFSGTRVGLFTTNFQTGAEGLPFSSLDVEQFIQLGGGQFTGEILMMESGYRRFALVVENREAVLVWGQAFSQNASLFKKEYNDITPAKQARSVPQKTSDALKVMLKNSGLGLYRTIEGSKTQFIRVNAIMYKTE